MSQRSVCIRVFEIDLVGGIDVPMSNDRSVRVHFLAEGVHADFDRLNEMGDTENPALVLSKAGTLLSGELVELDDIVGWAFENGYLDHKGEG